MKTLPLILAVLLFISCKEMKEINDNKIDTTNEQKSVSKESEVTPIQETTADDDFKNDFNILLPTEYRDWGNKNDANDLTKDWVELYEKEGKYYLGKADYIIKRGYDDCTGDSTKVINTTNKTILLIDNSNLELGEIYSLKIIKNKIWPKEKILFIFGKDEYTLRAEGKILSSENVNTDNGQELYQKVEDYKLYISKNNSTETLFLEQKSFNDTFVELLFIGDIDKDGKADLVFEANRDYEEKRIFLYLSSKAEEGKIIKKVSEISIQFDC